VLGSLDSNFTTTHLTLHAGSRWPLTPHIPLTPETEAERPAFDRERTFEMMQTPDTEFKAGQGLNNLVRG
jgi:hypothetical protein